MFNLITLNPLNAELNPICHLLTLLEAHHILHVGGIRVNDKHALGRTPLHLGSARRRDLYLTTHKIHKKQASMPQAGFEPAILASKCPQNYVLDGAATGIGCSKL